FVFARTTVDSGETLERLLANRLRQSASQSHLVQVDRATPVGRVLQHSSERVQIERIIECCRLERHSIRGMDGKSSQRDDIVDIVSKNRLECRRRTPLHIVEERLRDHGTRNVRPAKERNHFSLESDQAATAVAVSPELSRCKKEIEMGYGL